MNAQRLFIIALVVIAILFFCGAGAGFLGGDQKVDPNVGWVKALGNVAVGKQTLPRQDISTAQAGCLTQTQFQVPFGGSCQYDVRKSSTQVRTMKLRLVQGTAATVIVAPKGKDAITATETVQDAKDMDIYSEGATVLVACSGGCRLAFR